MMIRRRRLSALAVLSLTLTLGAAITPVAAQEWPSKPVRILVSFAPGGLTDTIARALLPRLQEGFGQPVVIDNKPGAGGTVAEAQLAKSAPDGYTVLLSADSVPANPHLIAKLPYDTFKDLLPIGMVARIPLVLVANNDVPATTVKDFVAYAKSSNVSRASYGSPGIGTSNHLYFEVLKDLTGIDMPHVAYKGGGPAMTDLMGGHIQAMLISSTLAVPQVQAGRIRALAVTSERRLPQLPNVPTFADAGMADFKPQQWTGIFVPVGTPPTVVLRIQTEFAKALRSPDVVARLAVLNAEPVSMSQADFLTFLRRESAALGQLIKARNISAN